MTDKQTDETIERYTEASFSSSFYMFHSNGLKVLLTVRDSKVQRGLEKMNLVIKTLTEGGYTYEGMPGEESRPKVQDCYGFQVIKKTDKGKTKITVELPFKLGNGEEADYPKTISTAAGVELFMKAMADQGMDTESLEYGTLYDVPIRVTTKQGKEIPNTDPVKHYVDWLGFEIIQPEKPAAPPAKPATPPAKTGKKQPPKHEEPQDEEIPF